MNGLQLAFASGIRSVEFLTSSIIIGGIALSKARLIAFGFAVVITALAHWFLQATKFGKANSGDDPVLMRQGCQRQRRAPGTTEYLGPQACRVPAPQLARRFLT